MMNRNVATREQAAVDVKNLCSRKLLELVSTRAVDPRELWAVVDELQQRRHYLDELERALPQAVRH
jgi:hypothetical protein